MATSGHGNRSPQARAVQPSWPTLRMVSSTGYPSAISMSSVTAPSRLVGEQQMRAVDQGPGDGDPLLFAAGHP